MRTGLRILCAIAGAFLLFSLINALSVSNLSKSCLQCLCWSASNCTLDITGRGGYEGPFWISRVYWADAGKPTLQHDDPARDGAYPDCAKVYNCAVMIVTKYMQRFGVDCNKDGMTDCDDFARIHYLGECGNATELIMSNFGRRYQQCRKIAIQANPLYERLSDSVN